MLEINTNTTKITHGAYVLSVVYCGEMINDPTKIIYSKAIQVSMAIYDTSLVDPSPIVISDL
jgi:hypothetical protein